jgi:hypothetical protein
MTRPPKLPGKTWRTASLETRVSKYPVDPRTRVSRHPRSNEHDLGQTGDTSKLARSVKRLMAMPIEKVQLKRLQVHARLSEETTAFAADVWIDGKRAGYAKNDGHGGETFVHVTNPVLATALREYGDARVPNEYKAFTPGDAWIVDGLVEEALAAKEIARVAKKTARVDAEFQVDCEARGTHAARFKTDGGRTTRWIEYRDENTAKSQVEKKYGVFSDWTVIA